jgi:hypothetical protein
MGRPEDFLIDCHVDFLNCSDFRWNFGGYASASGFSVRGGIRLNRSGPEGNAAMNETYSVTVHRNRARLQ